MPSTGRVQADVLAQRTKLANSYQELLNDFSSAELHSVGNYTLGRLIGKGSFGKVYLASHTLTNGSKVVLKSTNKNDSNLAREIHHHRQFLHPHIARLYEVIVTESLVWLVLEYCPGDELYNHLLKTGPIEADKVQKIFAQLVGAVSYVHNKSCVHRDLKLENILLDKQGNVKLVDFGFTREYEGKSSYLQTWCGTVCYSAPEMLKGEKYAGEKVDVWSLGIILYALLCGELPYDEDDETATKTRILKEEPKYPDHIPPGAKSLLVSLLSKRPLLRPSLSDILSNPWLAEHGPLQKAILNVQHAAPFSTELEKETLQRMRSAGVNIDHVIEHVLAQRCDALAGWWALLMEKEEKKAKRRELRRKEREAEVKSLRRLSGASGRFVAPTIKEINEESHGSDSRSRGRNPKRLSSASMATDLPRLPEIQASPELDASPKTATHPIPPDNPMSERSLSRPRPMPPPKDPEEDAKLEKRLDQRPQTHRSRSSMLQVVQANPELLNPNGFPPKRRKKYQQPFLNQFAQLKHWFKENARRARSPRPNRNASKLVPKNGQRRSRSPESGPRRGSIAGAASRRSSVIVRPNPAANTAQIRPRVQTTPSGNHVVDSNGLLSGDVDLARSASGGRGTAPRIRTSLSPAPLTPHSSYRRSSAGLRGRKSTSSSVSSIRSIHHHHTHSKASSTSSASLASPATASGKDRSTHRSPHTSVKVLPATPSSSAFPSNIRGARSSNHGYAQANGNGNGNSSAFTSNPPRSPAFFRPGAAASFMASVATGGRSNSNNNTPSSVNATESNAAFASLPPPSPSGFIFARRKRSPFKGPSLNFSLGSSPRASRSEASGSSGGLSRSGSKKGRASGEIIEEVEEEEEEEEGYGREFVALGEEEEEGNISHHHEHAIEDEDRRMGTETMTGTTIAGIDGDGMVVEVVDAFPPSGPDEEVVDILDDSGVGGVGLGDADVRGVQCVGK